MVAHTDAPVTGVTQLRTSQKAPAYVVEAEPLLTVVEFKDPRQHAPP